MGLEFLARPLDYIECLFISAAQEPRESPLERNLIHSVESALAHVERRLSQGLSRWLVVAVNDQPGLDQLDEPNFCVAHFLEQVSARWMRNQVTMIADVGLSPYLASGHSVVLKEGLVDLEASYQAAIRLALRFADAGAHYVAPCLSLPDQTSRLGAALRSRDLVCGLMPYSTKFSSSLYGPYRSTVGSSLGFARKSYQFDFSDAEMALHQMDEDFKQGAEIAIVKPALPYLDVLQDACRRSRRPVAVYHVSGEYAMHQAAFAQNWLSSDAVMLESLLCFKRAGADGILTYFAMDAARLLNG